MAQDIANGKLKIDRGPKNLVEKITNKILSVNFVKDQIFKKAKATVMKQTNGLYPAPLRILEVIRTGIDKGPVEGYEAEAKGFGQLAMTPQSKGLISLFFGQTECKKNRFGAPKSPAKYVASLSYVLLQFVLLIFQMYKLKKIFFNVEILPLLVLV